ncbi:MAG: hypothetical protein IPN71_16325 [Fibrobacteres bacterium]|nr:hypothetical protein [Fibrobacterota bacterium]
MELWLDPYYSAVNCTKTLAEGPIAKLVSDGERDTDWWLFEHIFQPRDLLVEASLNPLPVGGWAVRKWARGLPRRPGEECPLGEGADGRVSEPWAASVFWETWSTWCAERIPQVNGTAYSGFR